MSKKERTWLVRLALVLAILLMIIFIWLVRLSNQWRYDAARQMLDNVNATIVATIESGD